MLFKKRTDNRFFNAWNLYCVDSTCLSQSDQISLYTITVAVSRPLLGEQDGLDGPHKGPGTATLWHEYPGQLCRPRRHQDQVQ